MMLTVEIVGSMAMKDVSISFVSPYLSDAPACERVTKFQHNFTKHKQAEHKARDAGTRTLHAATKQCHHLQCCESCWATLEKSEVSDIAGKAARVEIQNRKIIEESIWFNRTRGLQHAINMPWNNGITAWSSIAIHEATIASEQNKNESYRLMHQALKWINITNSSIAECFQNSSVGGEITWSDCPPSCDKEGYVDCEDDDINGKDVKYAELSEDEQHSYVTKLKDEFLHTGSSPQDVLKMNAKKCARKECSASVSDVMALLEENVQQVKERIAKQNMMNNHDREVQAKGIARAMTLASFAQRLQDIVEEQVLLNREDALKSEEPHELTAKPVPSHHRQRRLLSYAGNDPAWPFSTRIHLKSGRTGLFCADRSNGIQCDAAFSCSGGEMCDPDTDKLASAVIFSVKVFEGRNKIVLQGGRLNQYCRDDWQNNKVMCDALHIRQEETFEFLAGKRYPGWVILKGGGAQCQAPSCSKDDLLPPWHFLCVDNTPKFL